MAYELSNPIRRVGPQNGSSGALWFYEDGDTVATIDGLNYFNLDAAKLKVGDFIIGTGNAVPFMVVVKSNTRDMEASPPVEGAVDVGNNLLTVNIDSD